MQYFSIPLNWAQQNCVLPNDGAVSTSTHDGNSLTPVLNNNNANCVCTNIMEKLDLSTYAKDIKNYYDSVVSGSNSYAIFTTLRDSSLKPTTLGDGDLKDFVSEFEEGSVQFGVISVNPYGSDVKKIVLLGWCPDSAPIKSKVSYANNLSNVGKILHYHVEITARDSDDLDIEDIMKTVSNASGARYSIQSLSPSSSSSSGSKFKPTPKPPSKLAEPETTKPAPSIIKPKPAAPPKTVSTDDGWEDEEEIEERDFSKKPLDNVPSAYQPTKVDINALRNSEPKKVESPKIATISVNPSGGLTSLPKPKPSNSVLSRFNQDEVVKTEFGTKAPVFNNGPLKDNSKLVGGLSRNFGADNGKTPAQIWAEKKGKYKDEGHDSTPVNASSEKEDTEDLEPVNEVKAKFEKLQLEAKKEMDEEEIKPSFPPKNTGSSFPPKTSSFPPPPARDTTSFPPATNSFKKFQEEEKEEEEEEDAWEEEETQESVKTPARSLPPPVEREPVATPARSEPEPPVAEKAPEIVSESKTSNTAVAEYDYEKDEDNEIGFVEGEIIIDIEFVDEDWWRGTNSNGETGLFPASYVSLKEEAKSETQAPPAAPERNLPPPPPERTSGPSAVAEFDYEASEDNELTFKEGDVITDIDQVDEDWWLGTFNGERKLFPSNYVSLKN